MLIELSHEEIETLLEWGGEQKTGLKLYIKLQQAEANLTELAEIDMNDCGDACKL